MNKEIISVVVLSYNSEKTIIETLDSILNQDYGSKFIELIIGDDASKDNTRSIILNWTNSHRNKFNNIILNLREENVGVVANFNSSCKLSNTKWIKPIAADDILMINCITEFSFYSLKKDIYCVFCKVEKFNENKKLGVSPLNNYYFNLPAKKQFESLLIDNFLLAPGCFFQKKLLEEISYINEKWFMEDYPLWLELTQKGIKLHLLEKVLVRYRIANSISNSNYRLINIRLNSDVYKCKMEYRKKLKTNFLHYCLISLDIKLFLISNLVKEYFFQNKKNKISSHLSSFLRLCSPLYLLRKKNQIRKNNVY